MFFRCSFINCCKYRSFPYKRTSQPDSTAFARSHQTKNCDTIKRKKARTHGFIRLACVSPTPTHAAHTHFDTRTRSHKHTYALIIWLNVVTVWVQLLQYLPPICYKMWRRITTGVGAAAWDAKSLSRKILRDPSESQRPKRRGEEKREKKFSFFTQKKCQLVPKV